MKKLGGIWEVGKVVLAVFLSAVVIRAVIFQPFVVDGKSMEPSYFNGEYVIVQKISYRLHQPQRGDVIVFHYPLDTKENYIKRVIGLPGETVKIDSGQVYINGKAISEDYLATGEQTTPLINPDVPYQVTVGPNQFFVMGDNRTHSADSREGWLVPTNLIVGKSALVLYPHPTLQAGAAPQYN